MQRLDQRLIEKRSEDAQRNALAHLQCANLLPVGTRRFTSGYLLPAAPRQTTPAAPRQTTPAAPRQTTPAAPRQTTTEANLGLTTTNGNKALKYDCDKCIAYCCSIYDRVQVTPRDIRRLAAHFRVLPEVATQRFTKVFQKERILRRKADRLFGQACMFLDQETRKCTIYDARPLTCREFPTTSRCAYYDLIEFEREQQGDPDVLPLVKITFKNE